jgi:RNA polymerase sigma-70 factor, ECF subfamily
MDATRLAVNGSTLKETLDEAAVIQQALHGDLEAFNQLVLIYQDLVYNQASWLLGGAVMAEDFSQDAFLIAFRKLHTYRGGSFKSWLLRIVTNLCYDELRRMKRHPNLPLEPTDDDGNEMESASWMVDPGESPQDAVERSELRRSIQNALDRLAPEYRSAVVLVDIQGLDYNEAAAAMGVNLGTVKSRLARGRLGLRDFLRMAQAV